ncbi:site-specific recombinase (plasmid) [Aggregatibacter actinomycetemcomitans D11S-1]|uniref:recombinase family protein n=3 Tax=Aggregatibacter actinomycetemcomitans TaxID=714 RepID=UPI0001BA1551|nr:recombinase family protein [Aggregatibacter actinomycetemcomitans]ACX80394.1 site-specific recombinase [Aggregatibacter actinomycetemcomitans D11S-1]TYA87122.1 recombinase family protein [Aggregatibacter actinomycetemcomitans]
MLVGYARVSTKEQNYEMQIQALRNAGCEKIFSEKESGNSDDRREFKKTLTFLREGDTLIVWKLDRLGRSVSQSSRVLETLKEKKVSVVSLIENIDTRTIFGEWLFYFASIFAEMERNSIIERTKAGIKFAREQGVRIGRPPKMTEDNIEIIRELLKAGWTVKKIAEKLGISQSSIYAYFPSDILEDLRPKAL